MSSLTRSKTLSDAISVLSDLVIHRGVPGDVRSGTGNDLVTRTVPATAPIGMENALTPLGHSLRGRSEAPCG